VSLENPVPSEEEPLLDADARSLGLRLLQTILHEDDELCGCARAGEGHQPRRSRDESR
jgi:hypothetical protein